MQSKFFLETMSVALQLGPLDSWGSPDVSPRKPPREGESQALALHPELEFCGTNKIPLSLKKKV
jgi:hypothetical protein